MPEKKDQWQAHLEESRVELLEAGALLTDRGVPRRDAEQKPLTFLQRFKMFLELVDRKLNT